MTTIDDSLSKIRSVRNDVWRCRRLLQTDLPDAEREIVERRLNEQLSTFEELLASTFPVGLALKQFGDRRDLEEIVSTERENLIGDTNGKDRRLQPRS
jgi:hypothetical protein